MSKRSSAPPASPPAPASQAEPLLRSIRSSKILPRHLERTAIVYVRQSTPLQVLEHTESKARQYALAAHASALGWSPSQVVVIDEDQGKSGRHSDQRSGFQRLLTEVTLGHVGLILSLEMSRLARSCKDWHHLLELCALRGTLLGDQDGIYNPMDSNDRLLLGLKGTMSEFELFTMRNRLQRGLQNKAERGELHIAPPIGYQRLPSGEVVQDTDEHVRSVVQLVFDQFDELGTARGVFAYLIANTIQLGFRFNRGPRRGQLEWRRPTMGAVWRILAHPMYAGAYVYGRKRADSGPGIPREERIRYRPPAWRILIKNHMPAYITWDRYEVNQKRLHANLRSAASAGVPHRGGGLLSGLAYCGTCGRRYHTYHPRTGKPYYFCCRHVETLQEQRCHGIASRAVDALVVEQTLVALQPSALQLSLRAIEDSHKERTRLEDQWSKKLERARYDVERAERQYQAVEPENRLVARTLEQRWESALIELRRLEDEYDRFRQERPQRLSESQRLQIEALSQNLSQVWHAASTTAADHKAILRLLIDRVTITSQKNSNVSQVVIIWKGGYSSHHEVVRAVKSLSQLSQDHRLRERVIELTQAGMTAPVIAATLTSEGFVTARQRGPFSHEIVRSLQKRYGLMNQDRNAPLKAHEWWVSDLVEELQMSQGVFHLWIHRKWCHARRFRRYWIVWADRTELKRLRKLRAFSQPGASNFPQELTTPTPRKH